MKIDLKKEFDNFIINNEYNYDYFKKCESPNLLNLYKQHGDYQLITIIVDRQIKQQELHELFRKELSNLYKYAVKNRLSIVGLKGVFLEDTLYNDSNFYRFYDDLDLLIVSSQKNKLSKYFIDDNFLIYDDKQMIFKCFFKIFKSNIRNMLKIDIDNINHIVLQKKINDFNLYFELHSNLNILRLSEFNHDELIKNKKLIVLQNNEEFFTLSDVDNLLFLCHHMIRHLPYVYQDCLGTMQINIDKVLDIALLINNNKINFEHILEKSVQYNIVPYVALALYITHGIFPSLIDNVVLKNMIKLSKKQIFSWKKIFMHLIRLEPIEILSGDIGKELPELVHAVEYIESKFGLFEEYTSYRNIKMIIWKIFLKKVV